MKYTCCCQILDEMNPEVGQMYIEFLKFHAKLFKYDGKRVVSYSGADFILRQSAIDDRFYLKYGIFKEI